MTLALLASLASSGCLGHRRGSEQADGRLLPLDWPHPSLETLKHERFENSAGVLPPEMKSAAQPDSERASASGVGTGGAWDKVYLYFHAAVQLAGPVRPSQDHSTEGMAPGPYTGPLASPPACAHSP